MSPVGFVDALILGIGPLFLSPLSEVCRSAVNSITANNLTSDSFTAGGSFTSCHSRFSLYGLSRVRWLRTPRQCLSLDSSMDCPAVHS